MVRCFPWRGSKPQSRHIQVHLPHLEVLQSWRLLCTWHVVVAIQELFAQHPSAPWMKTQIAPEVNGLNSLTCSSPGSLDPFPICSRHPLCTPWSWSSCLRIRNRSFIYYPELMLSLIAFPSGCPYVPWWLRDLQAISTTHSQCIIVIVALKKDHSELKILWLFVIVLY